MRRFIPHLSCLLNTKREPAANRFISSATGSVFTFVCEESKLPKRSPVKNAVVVHVNKKNNYEKNINTESGDWRVNDHIE